MAGIVAVREFLPALLRADLHDEDFAHHIWWTYRWIDPALFPNDLARYGVDVFVVNRGRYAPGKSLYFQPFYAVTQEQWARGSREGFVLRDPPPDRILFQQGEFSVIRVGPADEL